MRDFNSIREERRARRNDPSGRIWTGIFILLVGLAALLKAMMFPIPGWVFSWPMFLVALGMFLGFRHGFRGGAWFVLIIIGSVFLLDDFFPDLIMRRYLWPIALIVVGVFMVIRPRRRSWNPDGSSSGRANPQVTTANPFSETETTSDEDMIDSTSVFGATRKNIISKNFKGGEVLNILGGTELNMTQSDINGRIELEITQIFSGTKLIVPSNWRVVTETVAIFGGVEDKRAQTLESDAGKVLVLKGTTVFGGIDIRSF